MASTTFTADDARVVEGLELYPDADPAILVRIANEAQRLAEEAEAEGIAGGVSYSAGQTEYGCDWKWGDGPVTRDEVGRIVPDEDAEPIARVFDCDGETVSLVTDPIGCDR